MYIYVCVHIYMDIWLAESSDQGINFSVPVGLLEYTLASHCSRTISYKVASPQV